MHPRTLGCGQVVVISAGGRVMSQPLRPCSCLHAAPALMGGNELHGGRAGQCAQSGDKSTWEDKISREVGSVGPGLTRSQSRSALAWGPSLLLPTDIEHQGPPTEGGTILSLETPARESLSPWGQDRLAHQTCPASLARPVPVVPRATLVSSTAGSWNNHLDPMLSKAPWSEEEDRIIIQTQSIHGNKWAEMSRLLPGRQGIQDILTIFIPYSLNTSPLIAPLHCCSRAASETTVPLSCEQNLETGPRGRDEAPQGLVLYAHVASSYLRRSLPGRMMMAHAEISL